MSTKEMPEWLKVSRANLLIIQAAESAFTKGCDCDTCQLLREWAIIAPPPPKPEIPGGRQVGKARRA